jgi:hypothetical protein
MADNSSELSDDILVAFADNELPEVDMLRLTPLIEGNPEAASKVGAYRRSGKQLQDFFSVEIPTVTPPDIAAKIRAMEGAEHTTADVVSLETYRQRMARGFRRMSSGAGLQKIAASLIVGAFVGAGGTSLYDYGGQSGLNEISGFRGSNEVSGFKTRGVSSTQSPEANGLLLKAADGTYGTFRSGSTISQARNYRIEISTEGAKTVTLKYHEGAEEPHILMDRESTGGLKTMLFPKSIKINTKKTGAPFVTFEVVLEMKGETIRKFSVFGINLE